MLEPNHSESTSPAKVSRDLMRADLQRTTAELAAVLVPLFAPELAGLVNHPLARLAGLTPQRASSLLQSDLDQKIGNLLNRVSALNDDDLALIIDGVALRLAAWRLVRPPAATTPELEAALEHLRAVLE